MLRLFTCHEVAVSGKAVVGAGVTVNKAHHSDMGAGLPWHSGLCWLSFQNGREQAWKKQENYRIHGQHHKNGGKLLSSVLCVMMFCNGFAFKGWHIVMGFLCRQWGADFSGEPNFKRKDGNNLSFSIRNKDMWMLFGNIWSLWVGERIDSWFFGIFWSWESHSLSLIA